MTHYAYDTDRHALIASWGTGAGNAASTLAVAPKTAEPDQLLELTQALGHLSGAAWRTYTHPASASASLAVNSEGWREHLIREHAADDEAQAAELRRVRITPLDPQRPARDLLEDLLSGIHACWLLFEEYAGTLEGSPDSEETWSDEEADVSTSKEQTAFIELVRTEAADEHDRLL